MQDYDSNLRKRTDEINLSALEVQFLRQANNPVSRLNLLARLEKLGLLSAFLEAESGTKK